MQSVDNKTTLGFHNHVGAIYVFCNRQHGCNWYTLDENEKPEPIVYTALTGYIKGLRYQKVIREGAETHKLLTTIEADKTYILESGFDANFSKGLIIAIANLTKEQLSKPLTIEPQAGDKKTVLFCRVWLGGELIKSTYNQDTNWKAVARTAVDLVKSLSA